MTLWPVLLVCLSTKLLGSLNNYSHSQKPPQSSQLDDLEDQERDSMASFNHLLSVVKPTRRTTIYLAILLLILGWAFGVAWMRRDEGGPREMPDNLKQRWFGIHPNF
jgi:hypothetical protein